MAIKYYWQVGARFRKAGEPKMTAAEWERIKEAKALQPDVFWRYGKASMAEDLHAMLPADVRALVEVQQFVDAPQPVL